MKPRTAVTALFFALLAGAIGWGVLADARATRLEALLAQIEVAEDTLPYEGVREMGGADGGVRLRIRSRSHVHRTDIDDDVRRRRRRRHLGELDGRG